MKFLLASLKTLTISKSCSEGRIKFLFRLPLISLVNFSNVPTFIAGFRNNFQNHKRVSK
jgi:hypothetical protein